MSGGNRSGRGVGLRRYDSIDEVALDRSQADRLVARLVTTTNSFFTQLRRGLDLGPTDLRAVEELWEHGPMSMSDLAGRIAVTRAAVTALVDRLEAGDWVMRTADRVDRRRTIIELAPGASERLLPLAKPWLERVQEAMLALDDASWPVVRDALVELHRISDEEAIVLRAQQGVSGD